MIEVFKLGGRIIVPNPVTGAETEMQNITFIERGRAGANGSLTATSDFLGTLVGENVGLEQIRTHTQAIPIDKVRLFPVGNTFEGHINRAMYSTPQMRTQEGVSARLIDGRPTFFKTTIEPVAKDDVDCRDANSVLVSYSPNAFANVRVSATEVRTAPALAAAGV